MSGKRPGVHYAVTTDGLEVPVIDVTHAAFAIPFDEAALRSMVERFRRDEARRRRIPKRVQRLLMGALVGRSRLGRGLLAGADSGGFDGMTMYLAKLGPENQGAWASRADRWIAASPATTLARVRLRSMARLLADGLAPALAARPGRPLQFVNIAGGPAADSWNALIHLRAERPALLEGRRVRIHVFDRDAEGPTFGTRAVEALRAPGAPLQGLDVELHYVAYDWREVAPLSQFLAEIAQEEPVLACSSEGGLFEYGSDAEITANLQALRAHAPGDAIVVGSVTRPTPSERVLAEIQVRPRSLEAFGALAASAGWRLSTVIEGQFAFVVTLRP